MAKRKLGPDVPRAAEGIRDGIQSGIAKGRRRAIVSMSKQEGQYQLARARRAFQNEQPPVPVQKIEQGVAKVRRRAVWELAKDEVEYQGDRLERAIAKVLETSGPVSTVTVGPTVLERDPLLNKSRTTKARPKPLVRKVRDRAAAARKAAITRKRNTGR